MESQCDCLLSAQVTWFPPVNEARIWILKKNKYNVCQRYDGILPPREKIVRNRENSKIFTHLHSTAERGGCFQRRLFVCLFVSFFVNTLTSERLNVGWWNLAHCTKISPEFEFGGHGPYPWVPTPQNVAVCWVTTQTSTNGCGRGRRGSKQVMQLCRPPVLRRWENQRMLSSFILSCNRPSTGTCAMSSCYKIDIFTGSIAQSANCRYLIYSEADFEVFRPAGATRCTDGVKFGMEEGTDLTDCPLLHAKFHPHRCNDKGIGPQKLKFLLRFDQNVEYKRPAGAYSLRDFNKICRVCTPSQMR